MLFALLRSALNSTKPVSEILFTDISPALWQTSSHSGSDGPSRGRITIPAGLLATPEGFEGKLGDGGREL